MFYFVKLGKADPSLASSPWRSLSRTNVNKSHFVAEAPNGGQTVGGHHAESVRSDYFSGI